MTQLDRNKSAYKLQNFGPVYCINLDDQEDRWEYMENQFKYWEVTDYHRISAYDGRDAVSYTHLTLPTTPYV